MLNFDEDHLEIRSILTRALIYLENSIYSIQNSNNEHLSLLNSHYRSV